MAKKDEKQTFVKFEIDKAPMPFFAYLLNHQADPAAATAPTDWCYDNPCPTKKYPSDQDEPTSPTWDR